MTKMWEQIEAFPRYFLNPSGEVLDSYRDTLITPNRVTGGAMAVSLRGEDGQYYTRSVKQLVARYFVPFDFDPDKYDLMTFDSSILLDNNQTNVSAKNIRIRPRWFALEYRRQFDKPYEWFLGPLVNDRTRIVYFTSRDAAIDLGLLMRNVLDSASRCDSENLLLKKYVFPTGDVFNFEGHSYNDVI
jgi:hypothetical protein